MLHRHAVPVLFYLIHDKHALPVVFSVRCSGASSQPCRLSGVQSSRQGRRFLSLVLLCGRGVATARLLPLSITVHTRVQMQRQSHIVPNHTPRKLLIHIHPAAGNMAAIMEVDEQMGKTFLQFEPAPRRGEPEVRQHASTSRCMHSSRVGPCSILLAQVRPMSSNNVSGLACQRQHSCRVEPLAFHPQMTSGIC